MFNAKFNAEFQLYRDMIFVDKKSFMFTDQKQYVKIIVLIFLFEYRRIKIDMSVTDCLIYNSCHPFSNRLLIPPESLNLIL